MVGSLAANDSRLSETTGEASITSGYQSPKDVKETDSVECPNIPSQIQILVVGGGPIGLLTGLLLQSHGFKPVILERWQKRLDQPKAHAVNPRSLEIFRQAGIDIKLLRKLGTASDETDMVHFLPRLTLPSYGAIPYERQDDAVREFTPEPLFNIAQPQLEDFLAKIVIERGIPLYKRQKWLNLKNSGDSTISTIENTATGENYRVQSKFLIGCDGANSRVRDELQINMLGAHGEDPSIRYYITIHIDADITPVLKGRTGQLFFVFSKEVSGGFIVYNQRNSVCLFTQVSKEISDEVDEKGARSMIDYAIGEQIPYNILRVSKWYSKPRVATSFQKGNCFLAGDAAHSFPPTGGIGDVGNLVWKLAFLESGLASPEFMKTYTLERRQVALANTIQSHLNEQRIWNISNALGLTSQSKISSEINPAMDIDENAHEGVKQAIEGNREHFDSLDLQLGYIYGKERDSTRSVSTYVASTESGARLPHAWIGRTKTISSLDFVPQDSFVVFVNGSINDGAWTGGSAFLKVQSTEDEDWAQWRNVVNMKDKALVVRPDQHILGHVKSYSEALQLIEGFLH